MKNMEYDNGRPLARLEKGDKAIISVAHTDTAREKDRVKYKNVPNGEYEATVIEEYRLECKKYPELSGSYAMWYGNKWGCTEGIYADEIKED